MNQLKLFLLLFINISNSFIYFNKINICKLQLIKTCFPDEEENKKNNIKIEKYEFILKNQYTLVWNYCEECQELLDSMDNLNLEYIYINQKDFSSDINYNNLFNKPLLYQEDKILANNLFDIYEIIHRV